MKKLVLLLVMTPAILFCAGFGIYSMRHAAKPPMVAKVENAEKEQGIKDAIDYLNKIRNNQITGTIDPNDVTAAYEQAKRLQQQKSSSNINWRNLGPDNIGGRTRCFLVDKNNTNNYFSGGVTGGLWISHTAGSSWTPYNDFSDNLILSCITQAANGDIYYGTGEANGSLGGFDGGGLWKSTDGGTTFTFLTSTSPSVNSAFTHTQEMASDPSNSNRIYVSTDGGLYSTNDGGATWFNPVVINHHKVVGFSTSVVTGSDGTVAVAIGGRVYVSPNGDSANYADVSGAAPKVAPANSVVLAIAPSDPNYIYASAVNSASDLQAISQSTDKGQTWTIIGNGGFADFNPFGNSSEHQGYYDNAIAVFPDNKNEILVGGIENWHWSDVQGWTQFTDQNYFSPFYVHADVHAIVFHPTDPNTFFITCDGGIFRTINRGSLFGNLNRDYVTTQFYSVAMSGNGLVMGGTQDNGTIFININGNTTKTGVDVNGGDGGQCEFSIIYPGALFTTVYYGSLSRSIEGSTPQSFYSPRCDSFLKANGASFVGCIALWERLSKVTWQGKPLDADTTFVAGFNGAVWMTKGAIDFSKTPNWFEIAAISGTVQNMVFSKDGNTLFVGNFYSGQVYRVTNLLAARDSASGDIGSSTCIVKTDLIGSFGQTVTGISVDTSNANNVAVSLGGYGNTNFIYYSTNALDTTASNVSFNPRQGSGANMLPRMPCYSVLIEAGNPHRVLVGTEKGVFVTDNIAVGNPVWNAANTGLANVVVWALRQQTQTFADSAGYIYAGTHGRGIYSSSSFSVPAVHVAVGIAENTALAGNLSLFPNPIADAGTITYQLPKTSDVVINIYNMEGKLVKNIAQAHQSAGDYRIALNASNLNAGAYLLNFKVDNAGKTLKFIVAK